MLKKILNKNELLKHVFVLVQGTIIAQVIGVLMQLVLRRVFSVSDFGVMALYSSIVGVLVILASGRYELAIVLPKEDKNAKAIFKISLLLSLAFNVLLFVVLLFTSNYLLDVIVQHEMIELNEVKNLVSVKYLIYCIPIGVFAMTLYNSFNYWYTRSKSYRSLSNSRIIQSAGQNGSNAAFGAAGFGFFGLFFGLILGLVTSTLFLFLKNTKIFNGDIGDTKENLKKYNDFPLKSLPSGLVNILATQLPNFFIFGFFGAQILGLFDIITKVLNVPITMVGKSVSQVFYKKISDDIQEGKKIGGYVKKSSVRLFLFMLVPMLIIFFFGEHLFAWFFGEKYRLSGQLAGYFSLFYLVRFVYYSQSTLFSAVRKIGIEFRQNLIFLVLQLAALLIGYYYYEDFVTTFKLLAASGAICYLFFIFVLIRTAQKIDA